MDYKREEVKFPSRGNTCRAWLYKPSVSDDTPRPCIVMAHGLGGTRDAGLEPYALKFTQAGFNALVFDYRHFGVSEGEPRQLCSVKKQLQDWAAAVEFVRGLQDIDPNRVALWGFSLSGAHALVTAVRDGRIAAVSVQAPVMDTFAAAARFLRAVGLMKFIKSFALGAVDILRTWLGMTPIYVPVYGPPHDLAPLCSNEDIRDYEAITPPNWRNEICARYGLLFKGYRAIASASKLQCPTLIQVAMQDSVTPPGVAIKTARKIGTLAELKQYDCGHIGICLGDNYELASDDQLNFFSRVLTP